MGTIEQKNDDNSNQFPGGCSWLTIYIAIAIVVFLGLGGLVAHDLQPLTQQQSISAEINYLLTHPTALTQLVPFVVTYLIVMGLVYFIGLVLNRLFPRWAEIVADTLDASLRLLFSRFYARYREYLRFHVRSLDQSGIPDHGPWSLDLKQVFVDLKVEPQAVGEDQASPVRPLSPELRERQRRFFDFLTPRGDGDASHVVVIGPPGSGKTTMLRHTVLLLATGRHAQRTASMPARLRRLIPVLLYLREHIAQVQQAHDAMKVPNLSAAPYTLEDAVNDHLKFYVTDLSIPKGWLLRQLRRGRCLILLDGLDEVADAEQRQVLVGWVQKQINRYRTCRFVVTSRPHGYKGNTLNGVTVLGMCPYTRSQVQEYVRNWYHATESRSQGNRDDEGVKQRARLEARKLLDKIDELPDIYALATNPLLLAMICTVHRYKGSLPKRRVELYKDACDVLLVARQRAKGLPVVLTDDQAKGVLAPLAWAMMTNPQQAEDRRRWPKANVEQAILDPLARYTSMSANEFLRYVHESGLFLELEPGEYGFAHLTFQEYLAAVHVERTGPVGALISHIGESWWEETIRLYCAQVDATRASEIIEACLPRNETLPRADALTLALACIDEAQLVYQATKRRVQEYLVRCAEAPDAERQHIAAAALLADRLHKREMIYLGEGTRYNPALITCVEYQLFLDESIYSADEHIPPHWTGRHFASGDGLKPVLGVLPDAAIAFTAWLTHQSTSAECTFRLPHPEEAHTLVQTVPPALERPAGFWVQATDGTVSLADGGVPLLTATDLTYLDTLIHNDIRRSLVSAVDDRLQSTIVRARARALDVSVFDLTRISALARGSALARALDLASVNDLISNLARARDLSRARARDLASVSTRDRASTHARNLASALDRALARANSLARAIDRAHDLDLANDLVYAFDRAVAFDRARAFDRALSLARDHMNALVQALFRALELANSLARGPARVSSLDLDHALASGNSLADSLASDLDRALSLASNRVLDHDHFLDHDLDHADTFAQGKLRAVLLDEAHRAYSEEGSAEVLMRFPLLRKQLERASTSRAIAKLFLDAYSTLAVLKGRAEGWLPATEGILVVCDLP